MFAITDKIGSQGKGEKMRNFKVIKDIFSIWLIMPTILTIFLTVIYFDQARAWDDNPYQSLADQNYLVNPYVIKPDPSNSFGFERGIEMRRRFDPNPINKFRGTIDEYGNVRMRNLQGDYLRGHIDDDGYGRLHELFNPGNTYRVRPRR